ncbi:MAG TPA: FliH/SctL family protein [Actinoplanes sp.]|jgi:flagellar assembly protein FliH
MSSSPDQDLTQGAITEATFPAFGGGGAGGGAVLRGTAADTAAAARFAVDLRHEMPFDGEGVERAKKQARTEGYAEGWAQGQREAAIAAEAAVVRARTAEQAHDQRRSVALNQAINALGRAVTELESQLMPTFTELQDVLLVHAFELAEAIVGRSLDDPERRGADALRRAMAAAPETGNLVVHLHPADFQSLIGDSDSSDFEYEGRRVILRANATLRPGDATAETGMATVDATVAAAVARAKEALRV